jgi:hypothetical protein
MTLGSAGERPRLQDRLFHLMARRFAPTAAQGARPVLFAATSPGVRGGDFIGPGCGSACGDPGCVRPIDRARDEDLARRLWQVSEHMTGVRYTALGGWQLAVTVIGPHAGGSALGWDSGRAAARRSDRESALAVERDA